MTRTFRKRPWFMATTALVAAATMGGSALAAVNTVKIDVSVTGKATSLSINQDASGSLGNVVTDTGAAGGGQLAVRGQWNTLNIVQRDSGNTLGGAITASGTTGTLNLSYGTAAVGDHGNNVHSLTIGATTAPSNPTITVAIDNTDAATTPNTITDVLDGTGLTYNLAITGTDNTIGNTVASSGGALTVAETFTGDGNTVDNTIDASGAITLTETVTGNDNEITHTISGATTVTSTVTLASNNNSVTNLSDGAGAKTFSVVLNGVDGNTVTNDFTGGSGTQTSNLTSTGTSKLDFTLTAGGAGSSSTVNTVNLHGATTLAALVDITQGAGASLILTATGTGFDAGTGATGSNAIFVNQSAGAVANATFVAAANGYFVNIVQ
jgi:hypothetical protein